MADALHLGLLWSGVKVGRAAQPIEEGGVRGPEEDPPEKGPDDEASPSSFVGAVLLIEQLTCRAQPPL